RMKADGKVFKTGTGDEWMDCGNKAITLETNTNMLGVLKADGDEELIATSVTLDNARMIEPRVSGEHASLKDPTIGPNVSMGSHCVVENSTVKNSLIQDHTVIKNATLDNAMIGNHVAYNGNFTSVSIGDYSVFE